MIASLIVVGLGGAIGAVLRFAMTLIAKAQVFPAWVATFGVNIIGCFLMGLAFAYLSNKNVDETWRFFIMTGVLGGFTTFSTFSQEFFMLAKEGNLALAFAYMVGTLLLALVAFAFAYSLFHYILSKG